MKTKNEGQDLEGADEVEVRITKGRDGFELIIAGTKGLIIHLYHIKGSITVRDEREATTPSPRPRSRASTHPSAPIIQPEGSNYQ